MKDTFLTVSALFFSSETADVARQMLGEMKIYWQYRDMVGLQGRAAPRQAIVLLWKIHSCNTFQVVYLPWGAVDCLARPKRVYRAVRRFHLWNITTLLRLTLSGPTPRPRGMYYANLYARIYVRVARRKFVARFMRHRYIPTLDISRK